MEQQNIPNTQIVYLTQAPEEERDKDLKDAYNLKVLFTSSAGSSQSLVKFKLLRMDITGMSKGLAPESGPLYSSLSQEDLASEGHKVGTSVLWCPPW